MMSILNYDDIWRAADEARKRGDMSEYARLRGMLREYEKKLKGFVAELDKQEAAQEQEGQE